MTAAASGITTRRYFFGTSSFRPKSSATINAIAKRNPPLPWFQLRLNVSGNTDRAKSIGLAIIKIANITLLFCINLLEFMSEIYIPLRKSLQLFFV
jgi:hypothetical protein